MGNDHNSCLVVAVQFLEDLENLLGVFFVQSAGCSSQKIIAGFLAQTSGDRNPLLLTAGKLIGVLAPGCFQTNFTKEFVNAQGILAEIGANLNVFINGKLLEQIVLLKNKAQIVTSEFTSSSSERPVNGWPLKVISPEVTESRPLMTFRRVLFPLPLGSQNDNEFPFFDGQIDVFKSLGFDIAGLIDFGYIGHGDHKVSS